MKNKALFLIPLLLLFCLSSFAQTLEGIYSGTFKLNPKNNKGTVRLFVYQYKDILFAKYQIFNGNKKSGDPESQVYLMGSFSKATKKINLKDIEEQTRALCIGFPLDKFEGTFDASFNSLMPSVCYQCAGNQLLKEENSSAEWLQFKKQIDQLRVKILYPTTTSRQHRGVFYQLIQNKEWLILGSSKKLKLYIDNDSDWCADSIKAIAVVNSKMKAKEMQNEVFEMMSKTGGSIIANTLCENARGINIFRLDEDKMAISSMNNFAYDKKKHMLTAYSNASSTSSKYFLVSVTKVGQIFDETNKGYVVSLKNNTLTKDSIIASFGTALDFLSGKSFLFKTIQNDGFSILTFGNGMIMEQINGYVNFFDISYDREVFCYTDFQSNAYRCFKVGKTKANEFYLFEVAPYETNFKLPQGFPLKTLSDCDYLAYGTITEVKKDMIKSGMAQFKGKDFMFTSNEKFRTNVPSNLLLDIPGLNYRGLIQHIYYGQFEAVKNYDPRGIIFPAFHNYFLMNYYIKHRDKLPSNAVKVGFTLTESTVRNNITITENSESFTYLIEPRFESNFYKYLPMYKGAGLLTQWIGKDCSAILAKYPPESLVTRQLYENIYRYSTGQPPLSKF